jgi:hypothetical protein
MTEGTEGTTTVNDPGLLGRALGMITSPGATFQHVVREPRPAIMLLLVSVVIAIGAAAPQFTERGQQAVLTTQVEMMERMGVTVSDEMYANLERQASFGAYSSLVSTFIMMPLMALFFSALYWGVFNALMGGTATFKQVLGIVTHSMVIMAVGALIQAPIQMTQERLSLTGPFNLGALVPFLSDESFVARMLSGISAITVWQIVVIAIGLGVLYKRKSTGIAISLIALYVVLVAIGVSLFSAFMGRTGA